MDEKIEIKFFNEHQVRLKWDSKAEEYLFAIADIISLMTDDENPTNYSSKIKEIEKNHDVDLSNIYCTLKMPDAIGDDTSDCAGVLKIIKPSQSPKVDIN